MTADTISRHEHSSDPGNSSADMGPTPFSTMCVPLKPGIWRSDQPVSWETETETKEPLVLLQRKRRNRSFALPPFFPIAIITSRWRCTQQNPRAATVSDIGASNVTTLLQSSKYSQEPFLPFQFGFLRVTLTVFLSSGDGSFLLAERSCSMNTKLRKCQRCSFLSAKSHLNSLIQFV